MGRFKERVSTLNSEETKQVHRYHRRYVKSLPGKLDHASLVAVNLARMAGLDKGCYLQRTGSPRLSGTRRGGFVSPMFFRSRLRSFGLRSAPESGISADDVGWIHDS